MTYPGGKAGSGVYQQIINQIPPHDVYIAAFAGHDAVALRKKPAPGGSIVIDCDTEVIDWWNNQALPGVTAIHSDAISYLVTQLVLGKLQGRRVFVYADPPYLKFDVDGRPVRASDRDLYAHEFDTAKQHEEFLRVLLSLPCMVALSGYWSSLYESMLQGWRSISFNAQTRGGTTAREWLWMNYPEPVELHDYSYLGANYREREKITRQKKRWRARLLKMSPLQRYALLSSIAELHGAEEK